MTENSAEINPKKKHIYIIDEAGAVRGFVKKALTELDEYQVIEFESGHKGFSFLNENSSYPAPHILIFESKFRDLEAITQLKKLRKIPAYRNIPVIIFTNNHDKKQQNLFLQSGADEFLIKPSTPENLFLKVKTLLTNQDELTKLKIGQSDKAILMVNDNPQILEKTRSILSKNGYCVISCGNSLTALKKWQLKIRIAIIDINLPDIDGLTLAETVKNRFSNSKIILTVNAIEKEEIARASMLGIKDIIKHPITYNDLLLKIEAMLEPTPPIEKIELEKPYLSRLMAGIRPLPPVIDGNFSLPFEILLKLFDSYSELEQKQIIMADSSIWAMDNKIFDSIESKEPIIQEGRTVKKKMIQALVKANINPNGTILDFSGKEINYIKIIKSYDLGVFLFEKEPIDSTRIESKLSSSEFTKVILQEMPSGRKGEVIEAMVNIFGYLDLYFYYYELEKTNNNMLLHWLSVSFLSMIAVSRILEKSKFKIQERIKKALISLLGICGFLHDIGANKHICFKMPESDKYFDTYHAHIEKGFNTIEKVRIFECLKYVIKDHHKDLNTWSSKYDSCTKIVQIANDIDNLIMNNGVYMHGKKINPSPEPYSTEETCLIMLDYARRGVYDWELVEEFIIAIKGRL